MEKNLGMQGLAIVVDPRAVDKVAEDKLNNLVVLKPGSSSYWAGLLGIERERSRRLTVGTRTWMSLRRGCEHRSR